MKLLSIFFLLVFTLTVIQLEAQTRGCATHTISVEKAKLNPKSVQQQQWFEQQIQEYLLRKQQQRTSGTQAADTTFVIPVVVHVVHSVSSGSITASNISDAQIYTQLDILNQDFQHLNADTSSTPAIFAGYAADCKIKFCLATADPNGNPTTGITRTYNSRSSWGVSFSDETTLKALSYWPSDQYLNIWVCNLSGGVLGYAQLPGGYGLGGLDPSDNNATTDGVVIHYKAFGNTGTATAPYDLGRTTTHEVGHWLGMRHIWGDVDAAAGDYCGDDYVNDTPWQQTAHTNVHICGDQSLCQQSGGSYHDAMTCNYMDYSADNCMNMFTADQRDRMHAVMHLSPRRKALYHSRGCCMSGKGVAVPLEEDFSSLTNYLTDGWIQINGDSNETVTEKWETLQLANGNGVIAINNIGTYDTLSSGNKIYYDYLISPYVQISKAKSPLLTFDLAYASNGTLHTDSLVVSYAVNCDTSWTKIITLYGNNLLTTTRSTTSFIPADNEWINVRLDISALQNYDVARFRFEDYSKQVNTLYLDNINLYSNPSGFSLVVYPVPSDGVLTADIYYEGKRDLHWLVYNELGQKVIDYSEAQVFSYSNKIDLTQMPAGIYFVRVISDKDIVQKKVLIY